MAIAVVQQVAVSAFPIAAATFDVTIAPSQAGNKLWLALQRGSGSTNNPVITDDGTGETWTKRQDREEDSSVRLYERTAGTDGVTTITISNVTGSQRAHFAEVFELSGLTSTQDGLEDEVVGAGSSVTIESDGLTAELVPSAFICSVVTRQDEVTDITLESPHLEVSPADDAGETSGRGGVYIDLSGEPVKLRAKADAAVGSGRFIGAQLCIRGTDAIAPDYGVALPARIARPTPERIFYVSQGTGSDIRTTGQAQSQSTPWESVEHALSILDEADKLVVLDSGHYYASAGEGCHQWTPTGGRGGSEAGPVWVVAAEGERPTLHGGLEGPNINSAILFQSDGSKSPEWFGIEGFIFEPHPELDPDDDYSKLVEFFADGRECSHIELSKCIVRYASSQGIYIDGEYGSEDVQLWDMDVYENGRNTNHDPVGFQHGVYMEGLRHVIANSYFRDHARGNGIQLYVTAGTIGECLVVNTRSDRNESHAFVIGGEDGSDIYDNVFANNIGEHNLETGYEGLRDTEGTHRGNRGHRNSGFGNSQGNFHSDTGVLLYYNSIEEDSEPVGSAIDVSSPAAGTGAIAYTPPLDKNGIVRTSPDLGPVVATAPYLYRGESRARRLQGWMG